MDKGFMSVNVELDAGKAFLRSLYYQYADWGVDFGKPTVTYRNYCARFGIKIASVMDDGLRMIGILYPLLTLFRCFSI